MTDETDTPVPGRPIQPSAGEFGVTFRPPTPEDGLAVSRLIEACPPLDTNSLYSTLLLCSHFADTCILAERKGRILGWISGYRPPSDSDALFVWQVAVAEAARGRGLGKRMLNALFDLPAVRDARTLLTTVTPSNLTSRRMFADFAAQFGLTLEDRPHFDTDSHFGGAHEAEHLISIGPLDRARIAA